MNHVENRFSIKRIRKSSDSDYSTALKIYNETTPVDIKTNSNEITNWIDHPTDSSVPFELMVFVLYLDDQAVGFAMMSYLKYSNIIVIDYLSVYEKYRLNTVFFPYLSLLQNYLSKNQYDVSYIINEVSNKNKGLSIDKESKMFKKLFCLEGFGKLDAKYYTPPLGLNNHESIFEAHLYLKSVDDITIISKRTYMKIVESIYKDYFEAWYAPSFIDDSDRNRYKTIIENCIEKIEKSIISDQINVIYTDCPILGGKTLDKTNGVLPAPYKKRFSSIIPFIIAPMIIFPVLIIWFYAFILGKLGVPLNQAYSMIGSVIGALITSFTTIIIAKRKL